MEISKAYEPKKYEDGIYQKWEESGFFNPDVCVEKGVTTDNSPYFSMVLPPPNVTGTLHVGHASMLAIEDLLVRYHRLKGDRTLWLPGTDHAAIATEAKVEKMLIDKGTKNPKKELGREKFLKEVEKFAQASHDTIVNQCKKMGSSLDWSREAFTLDSQRNLAVRTVFKKMYDDGLIYRGNRVINWSVKGQSTCSDDELVSIERPGKIYTFKYSEDFPITIATTRPETKLGDTAVAVNPSDERYKKFIGKIFEVHNFADSGVNLKIQIIANDQVDMEYGTGAVGVTPAHSAVDFDMYLTQKSKGEEIGLIQVIGQDGKMTANAGKFAGLDTLQAREGVMEVLKKNNLFIKEEDTIQNVGTSDRFGDVVEALPMTQWFVDVNKKFKVTGSNFVAGLKLKDITDGGEYSLKELMQTVIKSGQIEIIPDRFNKTYFHWIDNLRDWCISRQLWYGHQIPVWYKGGETYAGIEAPQEDGWTQDPDTLDTWFSSGLWTFSTLGYPDLNAEDLKNFHPTTVMETGYDILFFWVARMILMTTYVMGDIPFEKVYLHGLVRDEQGRKMSKSLGNVINPLDTIAEYGADATRLSLVIGNSPGNDLRLSVDKVAGYRNFTNKLWNIARFMLINIDKPQSVVDLPVANTLADRWILNRLGKVAGEVTENIEKFNFSYAGEVLRDFTWGELADWYLEIAKVEGGKAEILNYLLNTVLKLWHPFMPFVTEQIWQEAYGDGLIMVAGWPKIKIEGNVDDFVLIKDIVSGIRALRAECKIEPVRKLNVAISGNKFIDLLHDNQDVIKQLGRLEVLTIEENISKPEGSVGFIVGGVEVFVDVGSTIDKEKETVRLQKEIEMTEKYLVGLESKLSNTEFVSNAPVAVVEKEKQKLAEAKDKVEKLKNQLNQLR